MNDLIQACKSELDQNLPYLRHPCDTISAIRRDLQRSFQVDAIEGLTNVAGLTAGSVLFALVVVPLGMAGKLNQ